MAASAAVFSEALRAAAERADSERRAEATVDAAMANAAVAAITSAAGSAKRRAFAADEIAAGRAGALASSLSSHSSALRGSGSSGGGGGGGAVHNTLSSHLADLVAAASPHGGSVGGGNSDDDYIPRAEAEAAVLRAVAACEASLAAAQRRADFAAATALERSAAAIRDAQDSAARALASVEAEARERIATERVRAIAAAASQIETARRDAAAARREAAAAQNAATLATSAAELTGRSDALVAEIDALREALAFQSSENDTLRTSLAASQRATAEAVAAVASAAAKAAEHVPSSAAQTQEAMDAMAARAALNDEIRALRMQLAIAFVAIAGADVLGGAVHDHALSTDAVWVDAALPRFDALTPRAITAIDSVRARLEALIAADSTTGGVMAPEAAFPAATLPSADAVVEFNFPSASEIESVLHGNKHSSPAAFDLVQSIMSGTDAAAADAAETVAKLSRALSHPAINGATFMRGGVEKIFGQAKQLAAQPPPPPGLPPSSSSVRNSVVRPGGAVAFELDDVTKALATPHAGLLALLAAGSTSDPRIGAAAVVEFLAVLSRWTPQAAPVIAALRNCVRAQGNHGNHSGVRGGELRSKNSIGIAEERAAAAMAEAHVARAAAARGVTAALTFARRAHAAAAELAGRVPQLSASLDAVVARALTCENAAASVLERTHEIKVDLDRAKARAEAAILTVSKLEHTLSPTVLETIGGGVSVVGKAVSNAFHVVEHSKGVSAVGKAVSTALHAVEHAMHIHRESEPSQPQLEAQGAADVAKSNNAEAPEQHHESFFEKVKHGAGHALHAIGHALHLDGHKTGLQDAPGIHDGIAAQKTTPLEPSSAQAPASEPALESTTPAEQVPISTMPVPVTEAPMQVPTSPSSALVPPSAAPVQAPPSAAPVQAPPSTAPVQAPSLEAAAPAPVPETSAQAQAPVSALSSAVEPGRDGFDLSFYHEANILPSTPEPLRPPPAQVAESAASSSKPSSAPPPPPVFPPSRSLDELMTSSQILTSRKGSEAPATPSVVSSRYLLPEAKSGVKEAAEAALKRVSVRRVVPNVPYFSVLASKQETLPRNERS